MPSRSYNSHDRKVRLASFSFKLLVKGGKKCLFTPSTSSNAHHTLIVGHLPNSKALYTVVGMLLTNRKRLHTAVWRHSTYGKPLHTGVWRHFTIGKSLQTLCFRLKTGFLCQIGPVDFCQPNFRLHRIRLFRYATPWLKLLTSFLWPSPNRNCRQGSTLWLVLLKVWQKGNSFSRFYRNTFFIARKP